MIFPRMAVTLKSERLLSLLAFGKGDFTWMPAPFSWNTCSMPWIDGRLLDRKTAALEVLALTHATQLALGADSLASVFETTASFLQLNFAQQHIAGTKQSCRKGLVRHWAYIENPEAAMRREFFLQDDQANKFWTIDVVAAEVVTANGRIGAKPRETRVAYPSIEAAKLMVEKEILSKRRKGYTEGNLENVPHYVKGLPPRFVRINHDDYHAQYVGRVADGSQFFLTHPFAPALGHVPGGSYIALYIFDEFGILTKARIEQQEATQTLVDAQTQSWLAALGKYRYSDIKVAPFSVEKFGRQFGLIFVPEDEDELGAWATVQPGDYMAFAPPWDGEYDT